MGTFAQFENGTIDGALGQVYNMGYKLEPWEVGLPEKEVGHG